MSDTERESSPEDRDVYSISLSVSLTYHHKGTGSKAKITKEVKKKETSFDLTGSDDPSHPPYAPFLRALLAAHGERKYQISQEKFFRFKYYHKGMK